MFSFGFWVIHRASLEDTLYIHVLYFPPTAFTPRHSAVVATDGRSSFPCVCATHASMTLRSEMSSVVNYINALVPILLGHLHFFVTTQFFFSTCHVQYIVPFSIPFHIPSHTYIYYATCFPISSLNGAPPSLHLKQTSAFFNITPYIQKSTNGVSRQEVMRNILHPSKCVVNRIYSLYERPRILGASGAICVKSMQDS